MPSKVKSAKSVKPRKKKEDLNDSEFTVKTTKPKKESKALKDTNDSKKSKDSGESTKPSKSTKLEECEKENNVQSTKSDTNEASNNVLKDRCVNKNVKDEEIIKKSQSTPALLVNSKITDYFEIRKSTRRCKSDLEKEKRNIIETSIKEMREEGLEVRNVPEKGRAVFSTRSFQRGDFVCEYAGEMISYKTAKKREELYAQDTSIGCYMYFFDYKSKSYCIDATAETNRLGRLLNHSKTGGNCHTKLFEMNSLPRLILIASRDIEPGEELTYDYGDRNKESIKTHPWLAM